MGKLVERIEDEHIVIDTQFLLFLHGHALQCLADSAFTGHLLKQLRKEIVRTKTRGIIHRPIKSGVATIYAKMAFDDYFELLDNQDQFKLSGYHNVFIVLYSILGAWKAMSAGNALNRLDKFETELLSMHCWTKSASSEEAADLMIHEGAAMLHEVVNYCRRSRAYEKIREIYAIQLADRVVQDRILAGFFAHLLKSLAPLNKRGFPTKFVSRVAWPAHVGRIIAARDRGRCAYCHVEMSQDLLARPNIDHIIPLAQGGCNDLLNLQLTCEDCNNKKSDTPKDIESSIPRYHFAATKRDNTIGFYTAAGIDPIVSYWMIGKS